MALYGGCVGACLAMIPRTFVAEQRRFLLVGLIESVRACALGTMALRTGDANSVEAIETIVTCLDVPMCVAFVAVMAAMRLSPGNDKVAASVTVGYATH